MLGRRVGCGIFGVPSVRLPRAVVVADGIVLVGGVEVVTTGATRTFVVEVLVGTDVAVVESREGAATLYCVVACLVCAPLPQELSWSEPRS